jgi:hypothetical protein
MLSDGIGEALRMRLWNWLEAACRAMKLQISGGNGISCSTAEFYSSTIRIPRILKMLVKLQFVLQESRLGQTQFFIRIPTGASRKPTGGNGIPEELVRFTVLVKW